MLARRCCELVVMGRRLDDHQRIAEPSEPFLEALMKQLTKIPLTGSARAGLGLWDCEILRSSF